SKVRREIDDALADMPDFGSAEEFNKVLSEGGYGNTEQLQEGIANLLYLVINKGIPAKDVLQMPPEMVETLYSHAYNMYNQGKYDEAEHLFRFLMLLDPLEAKYAFGQAAVSHMKKQYEQAGKMYYMCTLLNPDDPMPHYHASDCYMKLNDLGSALLSLEFAIDASEGKPEFKGLVEKARALKQALEERMGLSGDEMHKPTSAEAKKAEKLKKKKLMKKKKA
ncbi:MAG: SycD/LcrH family type III secretion system chaperone, partial [Chlamydiia bacterium]|nr:SycD/LcrH family type III secretion system chaperone [Chlamydiia bacterium]